MDEKIEWLKCLYSPGYFARHVSIYNATVRKWIPFELWPAQQEALAEIATHRYIVMLKARQLGMSWLTLTYALWMMLFHPAPNIMLMSKRDDESIELLTRLIQMYEYLPDWMKVRAVVQSSAHDFVLSNGSKAKAFPTSGGRSYTGTMVILDEADFMPDLNKVLNAIRPTIDAGGQLVMISTVDKEKPISPFKEIFRAAWYNKEGDYHPIFLSWRARPERTTEWREKIALDMRKQTGTNDGLYQEYPDNPEEALAPIEAAKRIPFEWIKRCYFTRSNRSSQPTHRPCPTSPSTRSQYRADTTSSAPTRPKATPTATTAPAMCSTPTPGKKWRSSQENGSRKYLVDLSIRLGYTTTTPRSCRSATTTVTP